MIPKRTIWIFLWDFFKWSCWKGFSLVGGGVEEMWAWAAAVHAHSPLPQTPPSTSELTVKPVRRERQRSETKRTPRWEFLASDIPQSPVFYDFFHGSDTGDFQLLFPAQVSLSQCLSVANDESILIQKASIWSCKYFLGWIITCGWAVWAYLQMSPLMLQSSYLISLKQVFFIASTLIVCSTSAGWAGWCQSWYSSLLIHAYERFLKFWLVNTCARAHTAKESPCCVHRKRLEILTGTESCPHPWTMILIFQTGLWDKTAYTLL